MSVQGLSNEELQKQYLTALAQDSAQRHGVPADLAVRMLAAESNFNPGARSSAGAIGPMQLMPATARELGVDPTDMRQNVDGGVRYLGQQLQRFNNDPRLAAAAYNAGPGAVQKYGGVPPYAETRAYVDKVAPQASPVSQMSDAQLMALYQQQKGQQQPQGSLGRDAILAITTGRLPPQPAVETGTDVAKSAGQGLWNGVKGLAGLPGDLRDLANAGLNRWAEKTLDGHPKELAAVKKMLGAADAVRPPILRGPSSADIQKAAQSAGLVGTPYVPQTGPGKLARTVGEFAPAAAMGPAGGARGIAGQLLGRAANVAVPAMASEGAGQAAEAAGASPGVQAGARLAGALVGGGLAGVAGASGAAKRTAQEAAAAVSAENPRVRGAVVNALTRDKVDPKALAQVLADHPERPAFLAGGENMKALAEVAAQSPGTARNSLAEAVSGFRAKAADAVAQDIGATLGGRGDYFAALERAATERATKAREGLAKLGEHLVTLDENSVQALRSDLARSAIEDAARNALASADPEQRLAGAMLRQLPEKLLDKPSATTIRVRDAQDISRALLDSADAAYRAGDAPKGAALKGLGKAVRSNASTPEKGGFAEYGAWLKQYGADSDHIEALELGRGVFKPAMDMNAENLRRQLADMPASAMDYFRKGVGEALLGQVRSTRGDVGAMRQLLRSKEFAERVKIAFPSEEAFSAFMAKAAQHVKDQEAMSLVLGNTAGGRAFARQAAADDLAGQQGGIAEMVLDGADLVLSPASAPMKGARLARQLAKRLPRKDRGVLADPEMNASLGEALSDPLKLAELLKADQAAVGATQAARRRLMSRSLPNAEAAALAEILAQQRGQ